MAELTNLLELHFRFTESVNAEFHKIKFLLACLSLCCTLAGMFLMTRVRHVTLKSPQGVINSTTCS